MSDARWRRVQDLYHGALERPALLRAEFLSEECAGDAGLRHEVQSLLDQPISADQFLVAGESSPDDTSSVRIGQLLGIYQVKAFIGRGGMGEVYRARDTKLDRDVAVKLLPNSFVSDPGRCARFEREARILATLNHPNIGAIYGLEDADGLRALVLEFVDGETLAVRIAHGPLPLKDALAIARQITDAVGAAHDKGIVHRDLKPSNVALTHDGTVKVLDFGLAKVGAEGSLPDLTNWPASGTRDGVIFGTAAYMSPEQARGQRVDKRADIWAFGCLLFEMLTARHPFAGATTTDTLAAIVEREPDWSALPEETPVNVMRLLKRCLEKDARKRLRDIADGGIELDDVTGGALEMSGTATGHARRRRREYVAWSFTAVGLIGLVASVLVSRDATPVASPVARTTLVLPADQRVVAGASDYPLAVSADGARLAYVAEVSGRAQLYVRELDALEPVAIAGTAGARHPFFSPDGQWIGFFAGGALQRVAAKGGAP